MPLFPASSIYSSEKDCLCLRFKLYTKGTMCVYFGDFFFHSNSITKANSYSCVRLFFIQFEVYYSIIHKHHNILIHSPVKVHLYWVCFLQIAPMGAFSCVSTDVHMQELALQTFPEMDCVSYEVFRCSMSREDAKVAVQFYTPTSTD